MSIVVVANEAPENVKDYAVNKNGLDVIIADDQLNEIEKVYKGDIESELTCFADLDFQDYDFVVFDTEGTINNMTRAILRVTNYILTPTQPSNIDINGIRDLLNTFKISKRKNHSSV